MVGTLLNACWISKAASEFDEKSKYYLRYVRKRDLQNRQTVRVSVYSGETIHQFQKYMGDPSWAKPRETRDGLRRERHRVRPHIRYEQSFLLRRVFDELDHARNCKNNHTNPRRRKIIIISIPFYFPTRRYILSPLYRPEPGQRPGGA